MRRSKPDSVREILFIKLSSLGDILLSSPVLELLHNTWPEARITYLVEQEGEPLIRHHPFLERVVVFDRRRAEACLPWRPWGAVREVRRTLRQLRERTYDLALDVQGLAKSWLFLRLVRARLRAGKGRFPGVAVKSPHDRSRVRHAVPSYFELTDRLGLARPPQDRMRPLLVIPREKQEQARTLAREFGEFVVLNPFTTWPSKRWPREDWIELGRALQARGLSPVVAGAPADRGQALQIVAGIGGQARTSAGDTDLLCFAGLLSRARAFVTVDSAPMHIGAALGVPMVALFGSTDPARTGPWLGKSVVLDQGCRKGHCLTRSCSTPQQCMGAIKVADVVRALEQLSQ